MGDQMKGMVLESLMVRKSSALQSVGLKKEMVRAPQKVLRTVRKRVPATAVALVCKTEARTGKVSEFLWVPQSDLVS